MHSVLLSEAQKAAIADVAIASSELEAEVERCIIELCKLWWPHGSILLNNVRIEAKLSIFQQLIDVEFHGKTIAEDFRFVCCNLKDLNAQRNTIIHGEWVTKSWSEELQGKKLKPGQYRKDIEEKNIVAYKKRHSKSPPAISARHVKKVADLMSLNRALLHQLFWEHFPERVRGLSGRPALPQKSSSQLREMIRKMGQSCQ